MTDFIALLGIDGVLCAAALGIATFRSKACSDGKAPAWSGWLVGLLFIGLWMPVGAAQLPLLAYVRGVTSDLSVTLFIVAVWSIHRHFRSTGRPAERELLGLYAAVLLASVVLYPTALGLGDWDAYRTGWGDAGLLAALMLVAGIGLWAGLWFFPAVIALALLAWTAGLFESTNLWDYLMDPWLTVLAWFSCASASLGRLRRSGTTQVGVQPPVS